MHELASLFTEPTRAIADALPRPFNLTFPAEPAYRFSTSHHFGTSATSAKGAHMFRRLCTFLAIALLGAHLSAAQEEHTHSAAEVLGEVSFPTTCSPAIQTEFNRAVALLHSFTYAPALEAFHKVADRDPHCAIAHWGAAMTYFRQLWDPAILPPTLATAQKEIDQAAQLNAGSNREKQFIAAAQLIFKDAATVPYPTRAQKYEQAMAALAEANNKDVEAQVFYALALLANASPADKTHSRQKRAADILEPLYRDHPRHPGLAHYLIHAYDNAELASRGLPMARAYSKIAPSAPHALHMPSHIFTRLGLWDDSIASNLASREAAHRAGDTGEELHAMDYLVYAYLQSDRDQEAASVIQQLKTMPALNLGDFKTGYAATAMPTRYAVERKQWTEAVTITAPEGAPPQVVAIAIWARGLGLARTARPAETPNLIADLQKIETQLQTSGSAYWAQQVSIMRQELMAWTAQAERKPADAVSILRQAADQEDAIEKLPMTPGPIIPAREQLGDLLLEQDRPDLAAAEFELSLKSAPGRRGSLRGAETATKHRTAGQ